MKHTGHPWRIEKTLAGNLAVYGDLELGDDASPVAMRIATRADAELICAAPELLEALKDVAGFDSIAEGKGLCWCSKDNAETCTQTTCIAARNAIAKAELNT